MTICGMVPTHNRPELLAACIAALRPQVDRLLIMDNASDPPARIPRQDGVGIIRHPDQPPNMPVMWRLALTWAAELGATYLACVCDDVEVPVGWIQAVVSAMDATGAAAGSTHAAQPVPYLIVKTVPDSDLWGRMCPAAFILRVGTVVPDPSMAWWWCDTDLDWQARANGGMVIAPGPSAINSQPNYWTVRRPELAAQAGADGLTFAAKWGGRPW